MAEFREDFKKQNQKMNGVKDNVDEYKNIVVNHIERRLEKVYNDFTKLATENAQMKGEISEIKSMHLQNGSKVIKISERQHILDDFLSKLKNQINDFNLSKVDSNIFKNYTIEFERSMKIIQENSDQNKAGLQTVERFIDKYIPIQI